MDHSALGVPLILAAELDGIPNRQRDARREIDIVGDQDGHLSVDPDDEALMAAPVTVIREQPFDASSRLDDYAGLPVSERVGNLAGGPTGQPVGGGKNSTTRCPGEVQVCACR